MEKEKELEAKDMFFSPEELKQAETLVPAGYIPVSLSSVGCLGLPSIIHVRDYSFDEALAFSDIDEENETEVIIQILNSIIFEDIDAGKLHKQDVLEILMTVQGAWYSPKLEDLPYYLDLDLPADEINQGTNIARMTFLLNDLKTEPLKKVKLPITIKNKTLEVKFTIARIENEVIAKKLIDTKYAQEANELAVIKKRVRAKTNSPEELVRYENYLRRRTEDFIRINQALLIESFNGKELTTLEEKLAILPELSLSLLKQYTEVMAEHFTFGIVPTLTFYSEELKKEITRRFDFRSVHFLSTLEQGNNAGFDISFG